MDPGEVVVAIAEMGTGLLTVGAIAWGAETQKRLDFTERLLAQGREPQQLPRG